ncbi:MAG TPA: beta-ketoacyl synthase N-terminal-like domain-containing protein [Myxococcaceae bacterium]|nr:beta-ketoacyl synthase N-terminal-like domain-containing protein [Myxococcaceae bacterium]
MSPEVAVTAWAVWSAGGVSVNEAPVDGSGPGLAPWPDRPAPIVRARGRPVPPGASALVQLVQAVLTTRRARVPTPPGTVDLRVGTRTGSREVDLAFLQSLAERGDAFGSPSLFAYTLSTAAGGEVSLALGLRGALSTVSTGEVSGLTALVTGAASVSSGRSEACLCGAMDVSGSESDVIALFLLEPAQPYLHAPRMVGWKLSFDPEARVTDSTRNSVRSTMERLAGALAHGESAEIQASCPGGHSALLTVIPEAGSTVHPERSDRVERR